MDLNEKIAARRRELAAVAEKDRQAAKAQKTERQKHIRDEAVKQLVAQGIESPISESVSREAVDAEIEKILTQAARARVTPSENLKSILLFVFGFLGFFITWWLGILLSVFGCLYTSKMLTKYKEEIKEEGKAKILDGENSNESEFLTTENKLEKVKLEVDGNIILDPKVQRIVLTSINHLKKVRVQLNKNMRHLAIFYLLMSSVAVLIVETSKNRTDAYFLIAKILAFWYWTPVLCLFYWLIFRGVVVVKEKTKVAELYFSEKELLISFPYLKAYPKFTIPWPALGEINHELEADHCKVKLSITDEKVKQRLKIISRMHFGNGILYGSPWYEGLNILSDTPPPAQVYETLNTWRALAVSKHMS